MTIHSVVIQKLLSTNAHLGRRVATHHFKIYTAGGTRNGMAIVDSDKTLICLRNACDFIGNLVRHRGRFLFVNTNPLFDEIIDQMTRKIGCRNDNSWKLGGFLTNSGSPKKFRSRNKKLNLGSVQPPDCLVIFDTERKSSVILEASRLQIPIVGLVDSSMPWETFKRITYPVPANDSVQFVYLFCNLITKTFLYEQKRFAAVTGNAASREERLTGSRSEKGEEVLPTSQSITNEAKDELLVIPYESLLPASNEFSETRKLLDKLVVLKFNGGLSSKMGFNGLKSSIEVCNGLTTLDLIVGQIESVNSKHGCSVPLILMNTTETHIDTLKVLDKYSKKNVNIHSFSQSQNLSVDEGQYSVDELYRSDVIKLFLSLKNSGTLDEMLLQGKEYILVVNSDNLAAVVDPTIINHMILNKVEYSMEVIPATVPNSQASSLSSIEAKFQATEKFKLIDTSNFWVNLKAIKRILESGKLNIEDHLVVKLFDRAIGINVPQSRFFPVTKTSDLLLLQSDLYTFDEGILSRNQARISPSNPSIELGPEFEKVSDFHSRFKSIPSIIELDSLKVTGDVWFGTDITLKGEVNIVAKPGTKLEIPDGVVLENKVISDPADI